MESKKVNSKVDEVKRGIALAICFISLSIFLFIKPNYFCNTIFSKVMGMVLGFIGFIGLSIELNRINNKNMKWEGIDDVAIGLVLFIVLFIINNYVNSDILKMFILILAIIPMYGFSIGLIKLYTFNSSMGIKLKQKIKFVFIVIFHVLSLVLTILQLLQIINFI